MNRLGWPSGSAPFARKRRRSAFPLAAAVLLSLAACSGSPASGTPTTSGSSAPASPTTPGAATNSAASSAQTEPDTATGIPIHITVNGEVLEGRLWDNAPGRDLASRLPVTLTFSDLSHQEKIGHLDQPLSMDGMPEGDDPVPTDIGWYAPWGNVVFYYGDVGYWDGIARIGQFDSPMNAVEQQSGDFTATIELAQ